MSNPCYITIDIEASGPNPHDYSMLSLGAATLDEPRKSFYVEFQPTSEKATETASLIHGLSMEKLAKDGLPPKEAMQRLATWLKEVSGKNKDIVFVAFNAPFDWMFVSDYFHRFLGHNPFGHRALDIKALFMGLHGIPWSATTHKAISEHYGLPNELPHRAEEDAIQEAEILKELLKELENVNPEWIEETIK